MNRKNFEIDINISSGIDYDFLKKYFIKNEKENACNVKYYTPDFTKLNEALSNGDALGSKTISSNDDNDDKKIKSVFKNQLKSTEQIKENLVKSPELKSKPLQNSTIKTFHDLVRTANEEKEVEEMFKDNFKVNFTSVDATEEFLGKLEGVEDPEKKRMIVGEEFVRVFTEFAEKNGPFKWLAQGTLYPDVIESGVSKGPAAVIKSHHNVGGLPDWLNLEVLEPLRELYKDEVRQIAKILQVPEKLFMRHPFPGPGLAVRIIGKITKTKLQICKVASKIVEEELIEAGWYSKVWQAYAAVGDDRAVGVVGDERRYGNIVMIRVVDSIDAMTADWTRLPHGLLEKMSNRITNEIEDVTWVTYTISSKPPATIEPQ